MKLEVVVKGKQWKFNEYSVKHAEMGARKAIYHIYRSGKYVGQRQCLEGCEDWIAEEINKSKKK